jgi:hypothetical protein
MNVKGDPLIGSLGKAIPLLSLIFSQTAGLAAHLVLHFPSILLS